MTKHLALVQKAPRMKIMTKSIVAGLGLVSVSHGQDFFRPAFHPAETGPSLWVTAHLNATVGHSSGHLEDLAGHAHDPNDEFTLQGLELGLNAKFTEKLSGFVNGVFFLDEADSLDSEWEEAFLKAEVWDGVEMRAGRMLNRFGLQNSKHLHGWDTVDANLSTSQFLGEEGLLSDGLDLTWTKKGYQWTSAVTVSYSQAVEHDHHGEEDHDDHGHGAEEAFLTKEIFTSRAMFIYQANDFNNHTLGLNFATGENGYGRDSKIFSADYAYTWSEKGLDLDGKYLTVGAEYFHRDVEWMHEEEDGEAGSSDQSSYMLYANYSFVEDWVLGLRYEHIQGVLAGGEIEAGEIEYAFATEERDRISLALTRHHTFNEDWTGFARVQYNHDDIKDEGKEDSIFLQIGLNLGGGEIR